MGKLRGLDIVCLAPVDWQFLLTRIQHIMQRLARHNRVLYVNPPATLLSPFKDPAFWPKWRPWGKRYSESPSLTVYQPPVVLPLGSYWQPVAWLNQRWLAPWVRREMRQLKMTRPIIFTYLPGTADLIRLLPHRLVIYDCVDEHGAFKGLIRPEVVWEQEKALLLRADLVFATASGLLERRRPFCRRIYLVPNAADVELFSQALKPETPVPEEIASLPRPRLCFVGAIQEWIDTGFLAGIARLRPNWQLLLIGPIAPGVPLEGLDKLPNVHFLGPRPHEVLPQYLKGCDVCLAPFRPGELTSKVNPLKLYEYLAAGRPVLATPWLDFGELKDLVALAQTPEEAVREVERILAEESEEKAKERLKRAAPHSWEARVSFMEEKIAELL
ncbi:glycosyl transferase group 1 [Ammonifex degensii KC4]|uniref:Glycosyl transferase group 1 n=1 Tax=Ammonifex degensii (strain DSM 10501 / KC4) TaxID=429009 RepID=C9RAK4_AMMDK|nr:glycosyltransferase [Ammonifex degensii]ACX51281.1 glycosyl transferase group 1 [Ammonifex degensii KC4]